MKQPQLTKLKKFEKFFNLEFGEDNEPDEVVAVQIDKDKKEDSEQEVEEVDKKVINNDLWLQSGKSLRRLVGILGVAMPFVLYFYLLFTTGQVEPLDSISHYYYTRAGTVFTVILSLLAIFLILYKTKWRIDFYVSTLAGITALIVVFLPTGNLYERCAVCLTDGSAPIVTYISDTALWPKVHLIAAAIFILSLAYMALFLFTQADKEKKDRKAPKKRRNRIYRVCGVMMIAALLVMVLGFAGVIPEDVYTAKKLTFFMESLAIFSFGVAWFVKGQTVFKDNPDDFE